MSTDTATATAPLAQLEQARTLDEFLTFRRSLGGRDEQIGLLRKAIAELSTARAPEKAWLRAAGLWALGRLREARETLESLESEDPIVAFVLGEVLIDAGEPAAAEKILCAAAKKLAHPMIAGRIAQARDAQGDFEGAAEAVKGVRHAEADYWRGVIAERAGRESEAIGYFEKALDQDAEHPEALFRLAYYTDLKGDDEAALEYYERLTRANPLKVNTLINLGLIYEDREEFQRAIECYEIVVQHDHNHARARLYLKDARASLTMHYDEELERREDKRAQILRTPITEFELSVRSRNCLARMNIETLGDLIQKTEPELLSYKNFGETSLLEIKAILSSRNLRLGMTPDEAARIGEPTFDEEVPSTEDELLDRTVAELNLSVRVRKALERLGVRTVADLTEMSERDLTKQKNFGKMSLTELKAKLDELGLALAE